MPRPKYYGMNTVVPQITNNVLASDFGSNPDLYSDCMSELMKIKKTGTIERPYADAGLDTAAIE